MQSKLFHFDLLVFMFLFSFIATTFASKKNETNTKRIPLTNNLQNPNTHDSSQKEPNSFVSSTTENLHGSNIQNQDNATISFNLLKTKDEKNFNFHSDLLLKQKDKIAFDFVKPQTKKRLIVPSDLLNKLLQTSNVFRFIFPYLSLLELEFNFKCTSKTFYHLYVKILQEEKTFLQSCLQNEKVFLKNINYTRQYFDFFEKRLWNDPERIEYANVDSFFENLILLPKSIRQIISFKFDNIQYKYILFKNGYLSILKQNIKGKIVLASLKKDFEKFYPCDKSFRLDSFQKNCQLLYVRAFHGVGGKEIYIHLHKNDNFSQSIRQVKNYPKFLVTEPVPSNSKVFLKNLSGFLHHHLDFGSVVSLWKFEKQNNGIYKKICFPVFKRNVKEIKSKDFEHYAEDIQFILKTNED